METKELVFTSKMFEKYLWKSDILINDAGQRPASLLKPESVLKMSLLSSFVRLVATENFNSAF